PTYRSTLGRGKDPPSSRLPGSAENPGAVAYLCAPMLECSYVLVRGTQRPEGIEISTLSSRERLRKKVLEGARVSGACGRYTLGGPQRSPALQLSPPSRAATR